MVLVIACLALVVWVYSDPPGGGGSGRGSIFERKRKLLGRGPAMQRLDPAMIADLAIASLMAGASIPAALEALDWALAEEEKPSNLAVVGRSLVMGASWEEAWSAAGERFAPLREALEPSWKDGAAAVPLLVRSAMSVRSSREMRAKAAAARLGTSLVLPLGLCFLPAFILVGIVPIIASAGMGMFS